MSTESPEPEPQEATAKCLFERMGGQEPLEQMVDIVYDMMRDDFAMGFSFEKFQMPHLKQQTTEYLRGAWGGQPYIGQDLFVAHSGLGITNGQYDLMMGFYDKACKQLKLPEDVRSDILAEIEGMRNPVVDPDGKLKLEFEAKWDEITAKRQKDKEEKARRAAPKAPRTGAKPAAAAGADASGDAKAPSRAGPADPDAKRSARKPPAPGASKAKVAGKEPLAAERRGAAAADEATAPAIAAATSSTSGAKDCLYNRLGGKEKLEELVDIVYDMMKEDFTLGSFFDRFHLLSLKKGTVAYFGGAWGGPPYHGQDLFVAHSGLGITQQQYDAMVRIYELALKRMKVDAPVKKDVLESIEGMREPVVDPDGKLKKAFEEKWAKMRVEKETQQAEAKRIEAQKAQVRKATAQADSEATPPQSPGPRRTSGRKASRTPTGASAEALSHCTRRMGRTASSTSRKSSRKGSDSSMAKAKPEAKTELDFCFAPALDSEPLQVPVCHAVLLPTPQLLKGC